MDYLWLDDVADLVIVRSPHLRRVKLDGERGKQLWGDNGHKSSYWRYRYDDRHRDQGYLECSADHGAVLTVLLPRLSFIRMGPKTMAMVNADINAKKNTANKPYTLTLVSISGLPFSSVIGAP
jgi:hypothetical protein